MGRLNADELAAFVAASCERQGVAVRVTDPAAIGQVVALLGGGADRPVRGAAAPLRAVDPPLSEPPDGLDAAGVHGSSAGGGGLDRDVAEDRGDDRGLSGEVQSRPRSA